MSQFEALTNKDNINTLVGKALEEFQTVGKLKENAENLEDSGTMQKMELILHKKDIRVMKDFLVLVSIDIVKISSVKELNGVVMVFQKWIPMETL